MTPPDRSTLRPDDWSAGAERRYARRQAALADHYDVDVASHRLDTDAAGRVHCLEAGDRNAPTVCLLHGASLPAAAWIPLLPALVEEYHLVAPDMPGEGLSAKPRFGSRDLRAFATAYLAEVLDAFDAGRPHVVANSLGGLQAFWLAIDRGRVDRLCLAGAPAGLSRSYPWLVRLLTVHRVNRVLLALLTRGDSTANARSWLARFAVVDDGAVPDALYELYAARFGLPGLGESQLSLWEAAGSFPRMAPMLDVREEVVDIDRPTRFLWGTEDYYWGPSLGRSVAGRMADASVEVLDGHGHVPWLEPGDAVGRGVAPFLGPRP